MFDEDKLDSLSVQLGERDAPVSANQGHPFMTPKDSRKRASLTNPRAPASLAKKVKAEPDRMGDLEFMLEE